MLSWPCRGQRMIEYYRIERLQVALQCERGDLGLQGRIDRESIKQALLHIYENIDIQVIKCMQFIDILYIYFKLQKFEKPVMKELKILGTNQLEFMGIIIIWDSSQQVSLISSSICKYKDREKRLGPVAIQDLKDALIKEQPCAKISRLRDDIDLVYISGPSIIKNRLKPNNAIMSNCPGQTQLRCQLIHLQFNRALKCHHRWLNELWLNSDMIDHPFQEISSGFIKTREASQLEFAWFRSEKLDDFDPLSDTYSALIFKIGQGLAYMGSVGCTYTSFSLLISFFSIYVFSSINQQDSNTKSSLDGDFFEIKCDRHLSYLQAPQSLLQSHQTAMSTQQAKPERVTELNSQFY